MLALLVGNNHIEFAVLFDDVYALDIDFSELLLAALHCESGENQHRDDKCRDDGVSLEEPDFFF